MAAGTLTIYSKNKNVIRLSDLSGATIKMLGLCYFANPFSRVALARTKVLARVKPL